MPAQKPNSIDEYFSFLDELFDVWNFEKRLAIAAGMAERWLHVYQAFSLEEEWGDAGLMRRGLDAAWNHLAGETLDPHDLARYLGLVDDSTPHMDFFDDHAALAAAFIVREALECCAGENNRASAMQAVLSGFEAVLPLWEEELEAQPRLWKQITVRGEFEKQLRLIDEIEAIAQFNRETIQTFRKKMQDEAFLGAVAPTAKPSSSGPVTVTNQWAFERFRAVVEVDVQQGWVDWEEEFETGSFGWAMMVFSEWSGRYGRRQQILDGEYGKLGDTVGIQALMARNRFVDASVEGVPEWGSEMEEVIQMIAQNPRNGLDVTSAYMPHSYGPSFRRLWIEGESSEQEPWNYIRVWKSHVPSAWAMEDDRKKRGQAFSTPDIGQRMTRDIDWHVTGEPVFPWKAEVDGEVWQVRINDFPDEVLYTLIIDGEPSGDFHDWPETWTRDETLYGE